MKDPRQFCLSKGIYEHRAIEAAQLYAQQVVSDLTKMIEGYPAQPLHERLQDYINFDKVTL